MFWITLFIVAAIFFGIGYGCRTIAVPKTIEIQPDCEHKWCNINGYTQGGMIRTVTMIQQCEKCGENRTQTMLG